MLNVLTRAGAVAVAAAALALGLTACQPAIPTDPNANGGPPAAVPAPLAALGCRFTVTEPRHATYIVASATADCLRAASSFHMHISLARQDSANAPWDVIQTETCDLIPVQGKPSFCPIKIDCVTGWYRTQLLVTGSSDGQDFAYTPSQKPINLVICDSFSPSAPPVNTM